MQGRPGCSVVVVDADRGVAMGPVGSGHSGVGLVVWMYECMGV